MTRLAFQVQVAKEQGGWPPYSKVIFKTIQNTGSSHPISQCRNSFRFGPRCVLMIMRRTSAAAAAAAAVAAAPTHCLRERLCTLRARPIYPPPPPPSPPLPISDIVHCVATTMLRQAPSPCGASDPSPPANPRLVVQYAIPNPPPSCKSHAQQKHALISAARNAKRRSSHAQKLAASGED